MITPKISWSFDFFQVKKIENKNSIFKRVWDFLQTQNNKNSSKNKWRASLVAQWLKNPPPMQGHGFPGPGEGSVLWGN